MFLHHGNYYNSLEELVNTLRQFSRQSILNQHSNYTKECNFNYSKGTNVYAIA